MAVFYEASSAGATSFWPSILIPRVDVEVRHPKALVGSHRAVVVGMSYMVLSGTLAGLTRKATYNGRDMDSLGVQAWNNAEGAWTELFGILEAEPGGIAHGFVSGENLAMRWLRIGSVSYTGVDSFGTVTKSSGTGLSLTASSTPPAAGLAVQAFGARTGLSGYSQNQRYLSNESLSLAMGDVDGDGTAKSFAAAHSKSEPWGSVAAVLNPADLVATVKPLMCRPAFKLSGRRLPRPGVPRRVVIDLPAES